MTDRILTVKEAAAFLKVSHKSLYEAIRRGEIPHIRIGHVIRIPEKALETLIDKAIEEVNARKNVWGE